MSHDLRLIAVAVLVIVVCAPGAAYPKDPPCQMVKGLCVRDDPEADKEVIKKKKKAAEELEKKNNTLLVPEVSCGNGAPVTPDHQCRCPAGQVEGKNGLCAPVVQGQHPSTTTVCHPGQVLGTNGQCGCPRGQVKMTNGLCRFAVECPAGTVANDIGKCIPMTRTPVVQGQSPSRFDAPCPSGQVLFRTGRCVDAHRVGNDGPYGTQGYRPMRHGIYLEQR